MSTPSNSDPRLDQAAVSDESLLSAHEKLLGKQLDEKGKYRLLPLNVLFLFSGLIFFAGTYLNRYSGMFDPHVYNENGHPTTGEAAPAEKKDPIAEGKKAYNQICFTCHAATGQGLPGAIPPLAGSEWVTGSEERLIRVVLYGLTGPVKVAGHDYNNPAMVAFGKVAGGGFNWSDEKIAHVLTYIRQEWDNKAGPITTEQVAAVHGKEGDRKQFTADELLKLP